MADALFPRLASPDDHPALRFEDRTVTYRALAALAAGHAESLRAVGVKRGERVAVFTQPRFETLVALVGNALAGVVSVPLDPKLGARERAHVLEDAAPRAMFAARPDDIDEVGVHALTMRAAEESAEGNAPDDGDALVLYTSGTTGLPKGVPVTRSAMAACLDGLRDAWAWTPDDTVVHALPLFHVHGLVLGLFGSLRAGSTLHWLGGFDELRVADALTRSRSMLFAVPTMYHRLAERAQRHPEIARGLRAARLLVSGSAGLPLRDHARVEALAGQRVVERYGMTETLITCATRVDGERPAGRVGPVLPGLALRLLGDDGAELAARDDVTPGELALRGASVFRGYLNRPDATREAFDPEGFFHTGDLATVDAKGSVRVVGRRATDLIKCAGYRIGAGEVEGALLDHPDVAEAAVLGAPDDDLGERIVAWVVLRDGVEVGTSALIDHVAAQLSPHKRPREVRLVEALPRNAMGKVQKAALKSSL